MIWAATFGDTLHIWYEKNMMEEWIICIQILILYQIFRYFKKS